MFLTLDELFDFIDHCVCPDIFPDSVHIRDEIDTRKIPHQRSLTAIDHIESEMMPMPERIPERMGWASSTGLQRCTRAELEFLREYVRDLESFVEKLKKIVAKVKEKKRAEGGQSSNWQEIVASAYLERKKGKDEN
ncbi:hypothetical protein PHMEG_00019257 [Phytophthora megakarya]|uniref:Uncharacterized protein n=1 Tax=Phytophthora megakarya TaxID=4795 RepID=A0A225VSU4_9STRA|nr:hypothetical protein PHMEG_00019257 [Phytophthora megakarya]